MNKKPYKIENIAYFHSTITQYISDNIYVTMHRFLAILLCCAMCFWVFWVSYYNAAQNVNFPIEKEISESITLSNIGSMCGLKTL